LEISAKPVANFTLKTTRCKQLQEQIFEQKRPKSQKAELGNSKVLKGVSHHMRWSTYRSLL